MISFEIFFVIVSIVLHGFFSLAETSILTVRKSRLREIIDDPESPAPQIHRAEQLLALKLNPDGFLAVVQSGSVVFSFLAAILSTLIVIQGSVLRSDVSASRSLRR